MRDWKSLHTMSSHSYSTSSTMWVFLHQAINKFNVGLLCIFLTGSLVAVPLVPLILSLQVKHAGTLGVDVTDRGLFEPAVQLQEFFICWLCC